VTVKSFSPAHQIRRPGFQLLSLVTPPSTPSQKLVQTFADHPCLLPDQYNIYNSVYGSFLILTIFILFLTNIYRTRQQRQSPPTPITISPVEERQNGGNIPGLRPELAIWSPYTPWTPQVIPRSPSPRSAIPPSLRTTNGLAAPTLRAFSRPSSPHGSPLLSPMAFPHDDDEDDSLYPAQYAVRHEGLVPPIGNVKLPPSANESQHTTEHARKSSSQFLPAPGSRNTERQTRSWSRTFIIRGRRLRVNFWLPASFSFDVLKTLVGMGSSFSEIHGGKRRSVVVGTAVDGLAIVWPALIAWVAIARWMF
jgi:ethanolamine phosphate phosphodiesterase